MGLLKSLGLKKKSSSSSRSSPVPSPDEFDKSRNPSDQRINNNSYGRRAFVAASGSLMPSYIKSNPFDDRFKDSKSDGEVDGIDEEEDNSSRGEGGAGEGTEDETGVNGEEGDSVGELGDPLQERSLRRVAPILGNRIRTSSSLGKSSSSTDFSHNRIIKGGSLRSTSLSNSTSSSSSSSVYGLSTDQKKEMGSDESRRTTQKSVSLSERSSRHRRNPTIETILRNMYGGELPVSTTPKEKHVIEPLKGSQHTSGSKSGVLTPRDFPIERESHRTSKARSGVLTARDWSVSSNGTGHVAGNGTEEVGRQGSGQLTPREITEEERMSGANLSARSTRIGQVAPRDILLAESINGVKKTAGGSGTLQPRGGENSEEVEGGVQLGRSRSGQLLSRDFGRDFGASLGFDKLKQGPRSLSSHKSVKDIFQGERQQKGAAQRRLSRNKNAVHTTDEGDQATSGNGNAPTSISSTSSSSFSVGRRVSSRGRGNSDAWQEPIAEESEGGSGEMQAYRGSPATSSFRVDNNNNISKGGSSVASSPSQDQQRIHRDTTSPAKARLHNKPEGLFSPSRSVGSIGNTGSSSQRIQGAPQTASERLAASLALSLALVQAQKNARMASGGSHSIQGMPMSRVRQDGPGDNVLQRPFANVREKYQLQMEELGRGRFGVIRVCLDRKTGEKLACKSISKARLKTWQDADDVRREVTVMELLQGHPHVVSLKGAFEDPLNVHLVMELCEGGELFDRIMVKKRYTEQEGAIVCRTVVGVLRYCHALGYIHRDLKPENILLCSKDNDTSVKVIDFGVATPFTPGTPCKEEVGTPFYLAPEVLRNNYGPEADIWSAGVVLYILLCGVPPFWAKDTDGIRASILEGKLDLTSGPWKSVSEPAKDLVRQMLNMDSSLRIKGDQILAHPWIQNLGRV